MSDSVRPQRQQPTRLPRPWDSPGKNTGVGCHFLLQCMKVTSESEIAQSCPTLSDTTDCSPPGSSVHGFSRQEYWSGCGFYFMLTYVLCFHKVYNNIIEFAFSVLFLDSKHLKSGFKYETWWMHLRISRFNWFICTYFFSVEFQVAACEWELLMLFLKTYCTVLGRKKIPCWTIELILNFPSTTEEQYVLNIHLC